MKVSVAHTQETGLHPHIRLTTHLHNHPRTSLGHLPLWDMVTHLPHRLLVVVEEVEVIHSPIPATLVLVK